MTYREEELEKAVLNCVDKMDMESLLQYVIDDMYKYYTNTDKLSVDEFIEAYGND